jgi:hypothetical protein
VSTDLAVPARRLSTVFFFLSKNTMQINHSLALKQGMMEGVKAYTTSTSIACLDSLQNESKDYFSLYKNVV